MKLVTDFCASWSTRDLKQVFPRFAGTGVYRMSETTPPVTGHAGLTERLGSWMTVVGPHRVRDPRHLRPGSDGHQPSHRPFESKTRPLTWEGVGVFFVKDGKIQEWSDYTIRVVRPGQ